MERLRPRLRRNEKLQMGASVTTAMKMMSKIMDQRGFTLTELLAVMAILGILAGLVAGAMGGLGTSGRNAQLTGDQVTISTAVDRFFNLSFPQSYPVVRFEDTDPSFTVAGDQGVRLIDFDARLPQDPDQTFTPDFLKEVPDSAAIVSWRIDTNRGIPFFARDGSQLIPPAESRLNVAAKTSKKPGEVSAYTFTLIVKKLEASITSLSVEIPQGYVIGGQSLAPDTQIGTFSGSFPGDNPWNMGNVVPFTGLLQTTGVANEWELTIDYPNYINSTSGGIPARQDKVHKVSVITPSGDIPGRLTIEMDRIVETTEHNLAQETWDLEVFGTVLVSGTSVNIIINPSTAAVYRWLARELTTIDVEEFDDSVPGSQAVIIKE